METIVILDYQTGNVIFTKTDSEEIEIFVEEYCTSNAISINDIHWMSYENIIYDT